MHVIEPDVSISVIIAVYNNAETLRELYFRLRQVLEAYDGAFEIIFVNDASPDDSADIVSGISQDDHRVCLISFPENAGQHRAILTGLSCCTGGWAVVMDADLQDSPEDIPALLSSGEKGYDAVFASRQGAHEPLFQRLTSRALKGILHVICGMDPGTGTFAAVNRPMINRMVNMHGPYPYIPGMIHCTGLRVGSVPVTRARRTSGKSAYTPMGRLRLAWRAVAWVLSWKWNALFGA